MDRSAKAHCLILVLISSLTLWSGRSANAQSKGDVFFGYSFTSSGPSLSVTGGSHAVATAGRASLNGWDASASVKIVHFIRGVIDVGAGYGNLPVNSSAFGFPTQRSDIRTNLHTYLLGPRAVVTVGHVMPFAHALFGVAHQSLSGQNVFFLARQRDSSFALDFGGGMDFPLVSRVAGRIGADYLQTNLFHVTQRDPRILAGVVFHF